MTRRWSAGTHRAMSLPNVALIHQHVDYHASRTPDQPAIDDGKEVVTYGGLASSMHRLARAVRSFGTGRNDRIGLLMENGIDAFQGLLSILAADCCYVPLSPSFPVHRMEEMIRDAGIKYLITGKSQLSEFASLTREGRLSEIKGLIVPDGESAEAAELLGSIDSNSMRIIGSESLNQFSDSPCGYANIEEDLAYIIYTSGTTGKPKGVMITHRNVKSYINWAVDYFDIRASDRIANHAALSFDLSVFDVFASFFSGAALCPVLGAGNRAFPGKFMREQGITIWISVPSVLGILIKSGQLTPNSFAGRLRCVILAGEPLTTAHAGEWLKTHPDIPIFNLYGPTEATVLCTCHNVGRDSPFDPDKPVPIGRPTRDSEIFVLKEDSDNLADVGEAGRLMICGTQVAQGYWMNPSLTAEKFIPNPYKRHLGSLMYDTGDWGYMDQDGLLHFLGRKDSQVKIAGYRIELSEIEVALARHPFVAEAAAVLAAENSGRIIGVVALKQHVAGEPDDVEEELFNECERYLPSYMMPRQIVFLDELPRNANGKVDRNAIKKSLEAI